MVLTIAQTTWQLPLARPWVASTARPRPGAEETTAVRPNDCSDV
jgi:hypothetical protein